MAIKWEYDQEQACFVSRRNIYCSKPVATQLQALTIFVPESFMNTGGSINPEGTTTTPSGKSYTSQTVPIIFYNDIGGYAECEPAFLIDRNKRYLEDGYVLVSVGARGRQSKSVTGEAIGKAPAALVDLKAAIRWIRKHKEELPGDTEKIISVGTSAGGAMSSLLGVSGDNDRFLPYLKEIGAEMTTSDHLYAAQCYCPITLLEYADMAYEWMFQSKKIYTFSPRKRPERLSAAEQELSGKLAQEFPTFVDRLDLEEKLGQDGRSGSFYQGILASLSDSLNSFLDKQTESPISKQAILYELDEKNLWSIWQGDKAYVTDLDAYVRSFIGRMKPCPAFDGLDRRTPENEVFGDGKTDYRHFSRTLYEQLKSLDFSEAVLQAFIADLSSEQLEKIDLMDPIQFLSANRIDQSQQANFFRIRLGSKDTDTSFAISRLLYLSLKKNKIPVDYQLIWGLGHCDADYQGDFSHWVDQITE